jgi:ribosomal protein L16 Arg81 hydroxylase
MTTQNKPLYETLAAWLAPTTIDEFRSELWARRPLFREASAGRLDPVRKLCSWDVEKMMERHAADVLAWFQAPDGSHATASVAPRAAYGFYRAGMTLYVPEVADLGPLESAVAASLALPKKNVTSSIFFSHPGAKTRAHFDSVDTLTIQIKGQKRWRIARNDFAPLPTVSWATLDPTPAPELRYYAGEAMPDAMPPGAEEFTLRPGAVLYVPQGYWHETASDEESVSLHVHLKPLIWADALLNAVRASLLTQTAFREPANALWDPQARGEVAERAEALLRELAGVVERLRADDVLPTVASRSDGVRPGDRFVRRPLAGLSVAPPAGSGSTLRVTLAASEHRRERDTTVEMSPSYLEACRLFGRGTSAPAWSAAELADATPGLSVDEARGLVGLLLEAGFVRSADDEGHWGS